MGNSTISYTSKDYDVIGHEMNWTILNVSNIFECVDVFPYSPPPSNSSFSHVK